MKQREVYIRLVGDSWAVLYLKRTKYQHHSAAGFYGKDHTLDDVKAWVNKQPNLVLVEDPQCET